MKDFSLLFVQVTNATQEIRDSLSCWGTGRNGWFPVGTQAEMVGFFVTRKILVLLHHRTQIHNNSIMLAPSGDGKYLKTGSVFPPPINNLSLLGQATVFVANH